MEFHITGLYSFLACKPVVTICHTYTVCHSKCRHRVGERHIVGREGDSVVGRRRTLKGCVNAVHIIYITEVYNQHCIILMVFHAARLVCNPEASKIAVHCIFRVFRTFGCKNDVFFQSQIRTFCLDIYLQFVGLNVADFHLHCICATARYGKFVVDNSCSFRNNHLTGCVFLGCQNIVHFILVEEFVTERISVGDRAFKFVCRNLYR